MPDARTREEWNHYAMTYDQLTGQVVFYKSGTELNTQTLPSEINVIDPDDGKLAIGRYTLDGSNGWYGEATVDDLIFYDRVLNATEIKAIASVYNATIG